MTQNFWMLSNFFLYRSRVVKSLNFGPNVWRIWKFLDFAKFNPSHVLSLQKCQFWAKFLTWIKISWFCKISSFAGQEWSNSRFQAKFSTWLKISGFCQISPWILPNFPRGGGGHSHYGGGADVRLQRLPIFSAAVTQWPIFLMIVYAVTKRPDIFWWNVGFSITLTQRPPIFCIQLPQETTFCFNFSTNWSFLPFSMFFSSNSCF